LIHNVVMGNHQLGPDGILLDVGIHAFRNHFDDLRRHFPDMAHVLRHISLSQARPYDLCDVRRLISDALHIRDDLHSGGDLPQIAGHRLLLEQQLQAQRFNVPLHLVNLALQWLNLFCQCVIASIQRLCRL
jgi:DNA mismatch repair ATPase MutS